MHEAALIDEVVGTYGNTLACGHGVTGMAGGLYPVLARRLGNGFEIAPAKTLFRDFVRVGARIRITEREVIVGFGRRAHSPSLLAADFARKSAPIHWLRDRSLQPQFT